MSWSDDDDEFVPDAVENYELVDGRDQPVSFSCVPLNLIGDKFELEGSTDRVNSRVYLHGTTIDGREQIYKQILAWKCSYSAKPEIFVLSKGKFWIQVLKPSKRFQVTNMSTLIVLHLLHFVKLNPQATAEFVWNHLESVFSSSDVKPSELDIFYHILLVKDAFESDTDLQKSEFMCEILGMASKKRKILENITDEEPMKKPNLVVDETEYVNPLDLLKEKEPEEEEEDPEEVEEDPEEEEVEDPIPLSLSDLKEELKDIEDSNFLLPSQEKEHVGEGEETLEEEVEDYDDGDDELQLFDTCCAICDNGGDILCCEGPCMRSFHATRDSGDSNCRSLGLSQAQVNAMKVFYCKNCQYKKHQCSFCMKLGSSDSDAGAEVFCCVSAACGRFYHPQCVAKALHPENTSQARTVEAQVAAGDMFTCPVHKCFACGHGEDRDIHALQFAICRRCPKAYHRKCLPRNIPFVADPEKKILQRAWDGLLPNRILIYCRDHKFVRGLGTPARNHIDLFENSTVKNKYVAEESTTDKRILKINGQNAAKKLTQMNKRREIVFGLKARKNVTRLSSGFSHIRKTQYVERSLKNSATHGMFGYKEACHSSIPNGIRPSIKFRTSLENTCTNNPCHVWDVDQSEIERSVDSLIEEVNSSFSINYIRSHQRAVTFYNSPRESVEKSITMGKVEATVKAVHTALEKLNNGCSIEDAMKICGPEMIDQLHRWKNKLQLHLGPFLHGARYTSYGRHFTKLEKLEKIVDMLHWYAEDGDTIVDFSCGSNDFSWLMSKKLESSGKKCFFKNFDIIQPKNDFNFEKKDWFSVGERELPIGSRLIIGLNPPFGFKAKLANQFIDRALKFKPKLMILIVPPETQRLDQKQPPYGLIWEDAHLLAGKSFYLPGSIDVNNKKLEQWNNVSPPLSLWSRSDWIQKHKNISIMCNHLPKVREGLYPEQNVQPTPVSHFPVHGLFNVPQKVPEQGVGYEPQHYNHMPCAQPQNYSHMLNTQPQSSIQQNFPDPHHYSQMVGTQVQYSNPMPGTQVQLSNPILGTQAHYSNPMLGTQVHYSNPMLGTQVQYSNPMFGTQVQYSNPMLGTQSQFVPLNTFGAQPFWPNEYRHP